MPSLWILTGPQPGARLPILGERFTLGRSADCDAVLNNQQKNKSDSISRRHAVITQRGGEWFIADGDGKERPSHNGTFVNDERVSLAGRPLRDQDRIRICNVRLVFFLEPPSSFTPEAAVRHSDSGSCLDSQPADKLRALLDVSSELRGVLDPDVVLERTVDCLFRLFRRAERALVVFRESPDDPPEVRVLRTPDGAAADPRFSTSVVRRCLERLEAVLGNDLPAEFPDSESLSGLELQSLMCSPLWTPEGQALGVIQLDTRADARKFTPDDLRLFFGVASQASIALGTARLHRRTLALQRRARDLEVAQQVQLALLPRSLPTLPGYSFSAHYAAAEEVGGDYYDFVPLPGGRLAVLLGDVSGHGVAAGLLMARFGAEARACLEALPDPAAAVARMNDLVLRAGVEGRFVTLAAAVLDPAAHAVTVVNAGHPPPLVRRADGTVEEATGEGASGLPLGVAEDQTYGTCEVRLGPGDAVLLYSDGVPEALDAGENQFGDDALRAAFAAAGRTPAAGVEALAAAVRKHGVGCEPNDDITLACFGRAATG